MAYIKNEIHRCITEIVKEQYKEYHTKPDSIPFEDEELPPFEIMVYELYEMYNPPCFCSNCVAGNSEYGHYWGEGE